MQPEFIVRGRKELEASFIEMRREVLRGIKPALLAAAKPIADDAHGRTLTDIPSITDRWSQYRIGATVRGIYVAPKARRRGGSPRKNLAPMLEREMVAARDRNEAEVYAAIETVIGVASRTSGLA